MLALMPSADASIMLASQLKFTEQFLFEGFKHHLVQMEPFSPAALCVLVVT